jgi:hypothetical protein
LLTRSQARFALRNAGDDRRKLEVAVFDTFGFTTMPCSAKAFAAD